MRTAFLIPACVAVFMATSPVPLRGQAEPAAISLSEALELFGRNSPQLGLARLRLREATGTSRQGRAIPNPVASFTHEDVGPYDETYLNVRQRIDFLWERGARRAGSRGRISEARALFVADSSQLALAVRGAWLNAWRSEGEYDGLVHVDSLFRLAIASAEERYGEGDLSGYDLRRMRLERARYERRLGIADVALDGARRRLGILVLGGEGPNTVRTGALSAGGPDRVGDDLLAGALDRRPELMAARAGAGAARAEAGLAARSMFSGTSVTGSYKRQSDGMDGFFVGLEFSLPFADRKGALNAAATAAADAAEGEAALMERVIRNEVELARLRLETLWARKSSLDQGELTQAQELLEIAGLLYEEGEIGVVELLDAAAAFLDAATLERGLRAELWMAHYELERAAGGFGRSSSGGENDE